LRLWPSIMTRACGTAAKTWTSGTGRPAQVFLSHNGLHMDGCAYFLEQGFRNSRYLGGIFRTDD